MARVLQCAICGAEYETNATRSLYCKKCSIEAQRYRAREYMTKKREMIRNGRTRDDAAGQPDQGEDATVVTPDKKARKYKVERNPLITGMLAEQTEQGNRSREYWEKFKEYYIGQYEEMGRDCPVTVNGISVYDDLFVDIMSDGSQKSYFIRNR